MTASPDALGRPMEDGRVSAQPGHTYYVKMDLGIAKYHVEISAGKENVQW